MKKVLLLSTALMFAVAISKAQTIPNASFENWTTHGTYETPDNWGSLNNKTTTNSVYTRQKATPGTVGSNYMKLTSKTVGSNVVNGIAVCGVLDSMTMMPKSGFPCTGRPAKLTGKWQHMIYGSSQGSISITLTRWDAGSKQRITVGSGSVTLSGMAMSWAGFTIPISYTDATNPDSCVIVMMASGTNPTNNDYLWVDDLAFSGSVSGVNKFNTSITGVAAYPNPATNLINVEIKMQNSEQVCFELMNSTGQTVWTKDLGIQTGVVQQQIGLEALPKGIYFLKINTSTSIATRNIVIE